MRALARYSLGLTSRGQGGRVETVRTLEIDVGCVLTFNMLGTSGPALMEKRVVLRSRCQERFIK